MIWTVILTVGGKYSRSLFHIGSHDPNVAWRNLAEKIDLESQEEIACIIPGEHRPWSASLQSYLLKRFKMNRELLAAINLYVNRMAEDVTRMIFSGEHDSDAIYDFPSGEELQDYLAEVKDRLGDKVDSPDRIFFYAPFITCDSVENLIEQCLGDDYYKEIIISIALFRNQDVLSVSADNVAIDGTSPGIHLNIFLTPETTLEDKNLLEEVGNSIRHEFEHFLQEDHPSILNYLEYHKIFCPVTRNPSAFFLYLVHPSEVSAHVRGYEHTSKNYDDFFKSIDNLFDIYKQKDILTESEISNVTACWEDWFLRNTYLSAISNQGEDHV